MTEQTDSRQPKQVRVGVGVILMKEGKVLIGKRKGSHGAGQWAFPGGHVDYEDETIFECCEREVLEETGIICECIKPEGYHGRDELFIDYSKSDKGDQYVTIYVLAKYKSGGNHNLNIVEDLEDKCDFWIWVDKDTLHKAHVENTDKGWINFEKINGHNNLKSLVLR